MVMLVATKYQSYLKLLCGALLAVTLHGANSQTLSLASKPTDLAKAALGSQPGAAVIGVWRGGKATYGYARNDSTGRAVLGDDQTQALFEIGSISKVFTGLLLAQAVEGGELRLDDNLGSLLQGQAKLSDSVAAITLKQLVTHSSCLPRMPANFFGDAAPENPYPNYGWDKMLAALVSLKLSSPPPCEAVYSNLGVALLGELLSQRYHKPWDELVRERITEPLGMKDTVRRLGDKAPRLAVSYSGTKAASPWEMQAFAGAGGLRSTAADMLTFGRAVLSGKAGPLGAAAERLVTPLGKIDFSDIGYAIHMRGPDSKRTYVHDGGTGGYRASWMLMPDTQEVAILMVSNAEAPIGRPVGDIFAARFPMSSQILEIDDARLPDFVGVFRINKGMAFTFVVQGNTLYGRLSGQAFSALTPSGADSFSFAAIGAQFDFSRKDGKVAAVTLTQRGAVILALRTDESAPSTATLNPDVAQAYGGQYRASDGTEFLVRTGQGQLTVTVNNKERFFVFPMAGKADRFLEEQTKAEGQFERDGSGKIIKLVVFQDGNETVAPRTAELPQPFSGAPVYLRGSMNDWGIQSQLVHDDRGRYIAKIALTKGRYEFKVGSEDWQTTDFGASGGGESVTLGSTKTLCEGGGNLVIEVQRSATYSFMVNAANPKSPVLTVSND